MNRLEKELRKRELHLRELAKQRTITIPADSKPFPDGTEIILTEHRKGEPWECSYCGRSFVSYPQLLNHRCHEG